MLGWGERLQRGGADCMGSLSSIHMEKQRAFTMGPANVPPYDTLDTPESVLLMGDPYLSSTVYPFHTDDKLRPELQELPCLVKLQYNGASENLTTKPKQV